MDSPALAGFIAPGATAGRSTAAGHGKANWAGSAKQPMNCRKSANNPVSQSVSLWLAKSGNWQMNSIGLLGIGNGEWTRWRHMGDNVGKWGKGCAEYEIEESQLK